jgi:DNA helicase-2/ATP-dependent DNA helicase PcrA
VSTFHSACARILRSEAPRLGYPPAFTIYDAADAGRLVAQVCSDQDLDAREVPPKAVAAEISRAKNDLVDFDTYKLRAEDDFQRTVADVYREYAARLQRAGAFDFDDLLAKTVELLWLFDDAREHYRERFAHVLVDEWQDTNHAQYELVRLLAEAHRRVCVVGDDAQSIYGFRGADIRNILEFERDFPDAARITLDRNYRSTQTILDAAGAVIAHNEAQFDKRLWTDAGEGEPVGRYTAENETDEAAFVATELERLVDAGEAAHGDIAVFYRTNAQARVLEEVLVRLGTPYRVVGGTRFYERAEIKDVLAYLRLLVNPADDVSARRVVNTPRRGIGAKSVEALDRFAAREQIPFLEACRRAEENHQLGQRAVGAVSEFVRLLDGLAAAAEDRNLADLVTLAGERTGYHEQLRAERSVESLGRLENLTELASVAEEFQATFPDADVPAFLERVALVSDADEAGDRSEGGGHVTLMTMHNAKGLEFPVVFVMGLEEGVFPHYRALAEPDQLAEERRLCYVAMTRAMRRLYVTRAERRTLFGGTSANRPARFWRELPDELVLDLGSGGGSAQQTLAETREDAEPLAAGNRVRHNQFGPGVVVERQGDKLRVDFDAYGEKWLMSGFAPLERA